MKRMYLSISLAFLSITGFAYTLPKMPHAQQQQLVTAAVVGDMAPAFSLKDMDGKTVTLADYKGKTVILDFWATWCGPCKASFPGMQMAVNKYKNDANVVFLFVDVSERVADYHTSISNFLTETKYPFYVIADGKNDKGEKNRIAKDYGITGIPTKVIIDKAGYIRFIKVGFSPDTTPDQLAEEIGEMIKTASRTNKNS